MNFIKNVIIGLSIVFLMMIYNCKNEEPVIEPNSVTAEGITFEWTSDSTYLDVTLSAETTGWIALGLDPSFAMQDANFIIGYVSGDSVYIRDDYGSEANYHESDVSGGGVDNVTNKTGTEESGVTTISFTIPLVSGDSRDRPLVIGETYTILLARGPNGADNFSTQHAVRTSLSVEL